ncbi:MAG: hypothetical protein B6D35_12820 [Candidatus Brocadia sp. UTAMX2]|jgi:peptidoglycan hydrolase CwlO-like protein|nr:MAG: hypothetical protein B6D35_12820 [Candidatus Brocadia sp. UTAMX2]
MKQRGSIVMALGFTTLVTGCVAASQRSPDIQAVPVGVNDRKIKELERGLSDLNDTTQALGKCVELLSSKTADADSNYTKLLSRLNELDSKIVLMDSSLENVVAETQKTVKDLEREMGEIEKAKTDLQNQLMALQAQRSRLTGKKIEQTKEVKEMLEQGREMLKDASSEIKPENDQKLKTIITNQEKEALQKLLDDALTLYREGNYKAAIGKWEEVLVIEPENLEAKFNIEIANEKVRSTSEK